MAQQIINVGSAPNDGTGDTLRNSQIKVNANVTELYNAVDLKLDKVTTVDVEKVYIKNADGTQGMKPVSEFGGGGSSVWVDYSSISTVVGWSTFSTKKIFYKIIDDYMFVSFLIDGSSNSASSSFTLPNASTVGFNLLLPCGYHVDNTSPNNLPPQIRVINGSNNILLYSNLSGVGWNASGQKGVAGQFSFKIN